jgi:hypothetical protein
MRVQRNIEGHSSYHCRGGKAISITYSDCVYVASIIQRAKRMGRIVLSSVACAVLPYFTTLFNKTYDYLKKKLWNTQCVMEHTICVMEHTIGGIEHTICVIEHTICVP